MVEDSVVKAAEKAWSSGRCVELKVTPSDGPEDLEPAAVVTTIAEPRSKIDGTPTGGKVTATLTSGGDSVDPNGSPVQADANATYTAPDEPDKSGTVAYESRSKRGVGKAELVFKTGAPASYRIAGGLEDWQVDQVICDVMAPFTLSVPEIGSGQFSGGLSGTYVVDGVFGLHYRGYIPDHPPRRSRQAGLDDGTSGGTIAGQSGYRQRDLHPDARHLLGARPIHSPGMKLGLQISSFSWPGGDAAIGPTLAPHRADRGRGRLRFHLGHGPLLPDPVDRAAGRADAGGLHDAGPPGRADHPGPAGPDGRRHPLPTGRACG